MRFHCFTKKLIGFHSVVAGAAILTTALLAGCGGGGSEAAASGTVPVAMFATDAVNDYAQVWVKVHGIRLVRPDGTAVTVFEDAAGTVTDLRALNQGGARQFSFLAQGNIPIGRYRRADVIVDHSVSLVNLAGVGVTKQFAASFDAPDGKTHIPVSIEAEVSSTTNVIVDFDLENWTETATHVTPSAKRIEDPNLGNDARHREEDYKGIIGSLAGTVPTQTFTLSGRGAAINVVTTADTVIFREDGGVNPVLANGQRAEIRGKFNISTRTITAKSIKIEDARAEEPKVFGPMSEINADAGSFFVEAKLVRGFIPSASMVKVQTSDTTRFRLRRGLTTTKAEWFALAKPAAPVEAEGVYNAETNTLTAKSVHFEGADDDGPGNEVEGKGAVSDINVLEKKFKITLSEWEGFPGAVGKVMSVNAAESQFKNRSGDMISAAAFLELIAAPGAVVKAKGRLDGDVIVADFCQVR